MTGKFAASYGSPGERPRVAGLARALWPLLVACCLGGYLVRAALPQPPLTGSVAGGLLLLLALLVAVSVAVMRHRFGAFMKGAYGEETVARALAFLPAGYHVFHGYSPTATGDVSPRRDFDHIVVGPAGICLVETKSWKGRMTLVGEKLLYDGKEPDRQPLLQVKDGARILGEALGDILGRPVDVQAVICSALNTVDGGRIVASGVIVCNERDITAVVREPGGVRLSRAEVDQIVASLRRSKG